MWQRGEGRQPFSSEEGAGSLVGRKEGEREKGRGKEMSRGLQRREGQMRRREEGQGRRERKGERRKGREEGGGRVRVGLVDMCEVKVDEKKKFEKKRNNLIIFEGY